MDQGTMEGFLVPGYVMLKVGLWVAAALASVVPAGLLAISSMPTAELPLNEAIVYGLRTTLFAASFMFLVYFITSQQIDREDGRGRLLMSGSRSLAAAMFSATAQVVALMAAALYHRAPQQLPSYTPWCLGAYAASLVLAHAHQAFPATLWLWPLGQLQTRVAPAAGRMLPPPLPQDGVLIQGCRLYIALLFWALYVQLTPQYLTEEWILSHATVAAVAYSIAFIHGFICSCLRWRNSSSSRASDSKKRA